MVISLIRKHLWMFGLCLALTSTDAFAQDSKVVPPEIQPQALPLKIVSPILESFERPRTHYQQDEIIVYQIRIKWPEPVMGVRMNSPQMALENLELIGIGEEAVSESEKVADDLSVEQILTLRFKGQHSGPAKIDSLILEWVQAGGASSSRLSIPAIELTIQKQKNPLFWIIISAASLIGLGASLLLFRIKKKTLQSVQPSESIEEMYLRQFDPLKNSITSDSNSKNFLNDLMKILDRYTQQKFDWNHSQEDYNALHKKVDNIWGQKEVRDLKELFDKIEYCRFSGSELKREELIPLFQSVRSFIERKKVI